MDTSPQSGRREHCPFSFSSPTSAALTKDSNVKVCTSLKTRPEDLNTMDEEELHPGLVYFLQDQLILKVRLQVGLTVTV